MGNAFFFEARVQSQVLEDLCNEDIIAKFGL